MNQLKIEINERLDELLKPVKNGAVKTAMQYSLLAPERD